MMKVETANAKLRMAHARPVKPGCRDSPSARIYIYIAVGSDYPGFVEAKHKVLDENNKLRADIVLVTKGSARELRTQVNRQIA